MQQRTFFIGFAAILGLMLAAAVGIPYVVPAGSQTQAEDILPEQLRPEPLTARLVTER